MNLSERQRLGILAVLGAMLAGGVVSSSQDDNGGVVLPLVRDASLVIGADTPSAQLTPSTMRLDVAKLSREPREEILVDIFMAKSWNPTPVPHAPSAAPAVLSKPAETSIPPLPFKYVGRLEGFHSKEVIYLVKAKRTYVVSAGEVVDETYRLDAVTEFQLTFTYIPAQIQQMLPIPARSR